MAKSCEVSGVTTRFSITRSHANNQSNRRVFVNLQTKRIFIPEFSRWVRLCASASVFRTISRKGWMPVFKKAYIRGTLASRLHVLLG